MKQIPDYPGYGSPCNGCGQCCIDQPCLVSRQYDLWRPWPKRGCIALKFRAGRYWCEMAITPKNVSRKFNNSAKHIIKDALGIIGKCDAKKIEQ